ncbi:MAG: hypothetical protein ABIA59_02425 [Candidatus Latescibacterota bacterium]
MADRIIRITITLFLTLLIIAAMNCGDDELTGPGNGSGGEDTTKPHLDFTPPQAVTDLSMTYSATERVAYLEWTAPWDDSLSEAVSRYVIRFTYTNPFIWDLSIPASDPPNPSAPGETQHYAIRYPLRGKNLFSAIRSVDEADNVSPISSIAMVHIPGYTVSGSCRDVLSGQPIAGLALEITSNWIHRCSTDIDGRYVVGDLAAGAASIKITTGAAGSAYHPLHQTFELVEDQDRTHHMIPVSAVESPRFLNLLTFLKLLTLPNNPPELGSVIATWKHRPVQCYIPPYVNTFGVDYAYESRRAAERWMDRSGVELFTFVDEPPDTGVIVHFKSPAEMGILIGITRHTQDTDSHPLRDDIEIVNNSPSSGAIYQVLLHELGHTIRFGHLAFSEFIMYQAGNLPSDIHQDEADAVKLLTSLPHRINMAIYDELNP